MLGVFFKMNEMHFTAQITDLEEFTDKKKTGDAGRLINHFKCILRD